jgi:nucleotide-binding universal stress UspA family protein
MQSILLHAYDDLGFWSRLHAACDLAQATGGQITCVHATPLEDYLSSDPITVALLGRDFSRKLDDRHAAFRDRVEKKLKSRRSSCDWVALDSSLSDALIRQSPLADVVVISQAGEALYKDEPRPLAATVLGHAKAPILVIPAELERYDTRAPVLIAWNASPESAIALRSSLPLIRMARAALILIVDNGGEPHAATDATKYLSAHGLHAEVVKRPRRETTSHTISDAARELDAGVIVMGAYGHSRLREYILGGTTRNMLHTSRVPLLMAH